ncbi:TrbI/VirB10 family protein [uncultured Algimonas sp.]|uniref:TrbI/VirB10 family protein n=1 Tax=uncultured Algimonas sp. TaxID=1547920 RepID=UPI00262CF53D|nr:TrbI/VirB10 family protein [uncultured Algimonas sp.]
MALLLAAGFAMRTPDNAAVAPQELYNTSNKALPEALSELPKEYGEIVPEPRRLGPPLPGDIGAGLHGQPKVVPDDNPFRYQPPSSYDYAPPPSYTLPQTTQANLPTARTSDLFFIAKAGGGDSAVATDASPAAFADPGVAALAELFAQSGGGFGLPATAIDTSSAAGERDARSDLSDSDIYNPHSLRSPVSPYQVMAGTIIPASLVTGLNSDLPGQVIAQVTENVYDSPTGQHLLIPQGTRLLGRYESDIEAGQSRALVVWSRLIRPDGSSMVIENLPGVDRMGQSGLRDRVDRHRGSLFGAAILSSVLSVASELGSDEDDRITEALRDGGQSTINQAGQKAVSQALSRKPTLRVRPGWRLGVIVNRDLVLSPYDKGG